MASQTDSPIGIRDTWATPPEFINWVEAVYGKITLDVCASAHNAKADKYFTEADDGLSQSWETPGWAWCNPPGSQVERWVAKALTQPQVLILVQQGTETPWFRDLVQGSIEVLLLSPRIQFVPPEGIKKTSNPRNYALAVINGYRGNTIKLERWKPWKHEK